MMLAGCTLAMPGVGADDAPETTGSLPARVEVEGPLPGTLAYSDAGKIGQAAAAALWQAEETAETEWINGATGSSGTLAGTDAPAEAPQDGCRGFDTIVTSIGGVHRYSGRICRSEDGRSLVRLAPPGGGNSS
jgi:hypothetical protein